MSKTSNQHSCITLFCTFLCRPCTTTTTWNDQIFSWLENGKCKVINYYPSLISDAVPSLQFQPSSNWLTWYNGEKNSKNVKSIFQRHFIGFARCRIVRSLMTHQYNFVPKVLSVFRGKRNNPQLGKMLNKKAHWSIRSMSVWLAKKNCLQTDQCTRFLGIARRPLPVTQRLASSKKSVDHFQLVFYSWTQLLWTLILLRNGYFNVIPCWGRF